MKTLKFIAIIVLSAVVALPMAILAMQVCSYEYAPVAVFIFGAFSIALLLGAFDMDAKKKSMRDTIRHRSGLRKAA